jgi:hypothetical protein
MCSRIGLFVVLDCDIIVIILFDIGLYESKE